VSGSSTSSLRAALLLALAALTLLLMLPTAASAQIGEWRHAWEVVQLVHLAPPGGTPIFFLGDSTAREATVSDAAWTRQLQRRAAAAGRTTATVVFTLATHGQTFGMDRQLIAAMPRRADHAPRGIALIGVGLSRFIGPPIRRPPSVVTPPPPGTVLVLHPWSQHRYTDRVPLPLARKQELVPRWMRRRWAGFHSNLSANFAALDRLLALCRAKGLRPVLVDTPLDVRVVGHGLDKARAVYRAGCRRLARRYHAPYLSLQPPSPLPTADYWDLMHLLPPGERVWQSRFSRRLAKLLPKAQPAN
jgi:hypothetical protein